MVMAQNMVVLLLVIFTRLMESVGKVGKTRVRGPLLVWPGQVGQSPAFVLGVLHQMVLHLGWHAIPVGWHSLEHLSIDQMLLHLLRLQRKHINALGNAQMESSLSPSWRQRV